MVIENVELMHECYPELLRMGTSVTLNKVKKRRKTENRKRVKMGKGTDSMKKQNC